MIRKLSHEPWYIWFKENFKWKQSFSPSNTNCLAAVSYSSPTACGLRSLLSPGGWVDVPQEECLLWQSEFTSSLWARRARSTRERELIMPVRPSTLRSCHLASVVCANRTGSWVFALGCLWEELAPACLEYKLRPLEENQTMLEIRFE